MAATQLSPNNSRPRHAAQSQAHDSAPSRPKATDCLRSNALCDKSGRVRWWRPAGLQKHLHHIREEQARTLSIDKAIVNLKVEALATLRTDACLAAGFGKNFIDYYMRIKEAEIARYRSEVTEWEQREYFELF